MSNTYHNIFTCTTIVTKETEKSDVKVNNGRKERNSDKGRKPVKFVWANDANNEITNKIPSDVKERLQIVFESYDMNNDGVISFIDLRTCFAQRGKNVPDSEIRRWLAEKDTVGDGVVTLDEFLMSYGNILNNGERSRAMMKEALEEEERLKKEHVVVDDDDDDDEMDLKKKKKKKKKKKSKYSDDDSSSGSDSDVDWRSKKKGGKKGKKKKKSKRYSSDDDYSSDGSSSSGGSSSGGGGGGGRRRRRRNGGRQ